MAIRPKIKEMSMQISGLAENRFQEFVTQIPKAPENILWVSHYFSEDLEQAFLGLPWLKVWDKKSQKVLEKWISRKKLPKIFAKEGFYGTGAHGNLLLLCSGKSLDFNVERFKYLASQAVHYALKKQVQQLYCYIRESANVQYSQETLSFFSSLWVEALHIGAYQFKGLKKENEETDPHRIQEIFFCFEKQESEQAIQVGIQEGQAISQGVRFAQDMVNQPSNRCTPRFWVQKTQELFKTQTSSLSIQVFDQKAVEDLDMGLLLAVAQGSEEPLQFLTLHYKPKETHQKTTEILGLIGKGITFDTGGISLKPPNNMHEMKADMAGGAAVIGALFGIAALKLGVEVFGIVPMTENMPSGKAIKPGDVIQSMSGKTVEILNTDAEGRLILADALHYAVRKGCTRMIDVATLTGSCVVALGESITGLFGNNQDFTQEFLNITKRTGEKTWPLPLFDEHREQLKSEVADLANIGGRYAGAITAAAFLESFVEKKPWIHLDIAGTSWANKAGYYSKGATGVMVSSFVRYAQSLAS